MFHAETLRRGCAGGSTTKPRHLLRTNELWYITAADVATQLRFSRDRGIPVDDVAVEIVTTRTAAGRPAGSAGPPARIDPSRGLSRTIPTRRPSLSRRWYYPGDLGVLSAEGALFLKGRATT